MSPPSGSLSVEDFAQSDDWQEVMKYARTDCFSTDPGSSRVAGFEIAEVAEVAAHANGKKDEEDWVAVLRLKDGRWAKVAAWCDYTGWGCMEGGRAYVAPTRAAIERFGLTDKERARLGVTLPG